MLKRWRPLNCLLWVIGLGVLNLFNLACTEVTETNSSNSISPQITVEIVEIEAQDEMTQLVEKELTRARILLAPERTKTEWVEVPLAHRPESVGALGGFGVKTTDPDVFGSVYVFEEWGAGAKVSWELLEADVPTEGTRTLKSANGRLFFFGYTTIVGDKGIEAKYRLSGLISAFAGDE